MKEKKGVRMDFIIITSMQTRFEQLLLIVYEGENICVVCVCVCVNRVVLQM